jgi:hypothetical protein
MRANAFRLSLDSATGSDAGGRTMDIFEVARIRYQFQLG